MALMLTKTYQAFLAAGVPTEKAEEASQEIAGYEDRIVRLEIKMNIILGGVGFLVLGMISLIVKAYFLGGSGGPSE